VTRRLLVLRALGLGDLLTAVPALRALRDAFPCHRLELACPAALEPLARLTGAVDDVVPVGPLEPLPASAAGADLAVNLHGRGPESHRVLLAARPGRLLAVRHTAVSQSADGPEHRDDEHEVARWCRLLRHYGIKADTARLRLDPPGIDPPAAAREATLIHPGAASESRRWPAERFAAVARAELAAGRRVVVTGGPGERALARHVARLAGLDDHAVLAGRTGLVELAAAIAAASRVVCGDTGVAHLATALGTPSVLLFGPTSPANWGPPAAWRARHRVLWAGREGDPQADRPDPGLLEIQPADVVRELHLLGRDESDAYPAAS
jgi:ADP-heptose:LPS heptosyltransferase